MLDPDEITRALGQLVPGDAFCAARSIADVPLHPGERVLVDGVADKVRRATATGRMLARQLVRDAGVVAGPILRGAAGEPLWPAGVFGSIAHDDDVAVCVVGRRPIGIDIEPALPLPAELSADVAPTDAEQGWLARDPLNGRRLFCAKEAAYKARYPVDRQFYEFKDLIFGHQPATNGYVSFRTPAGAPVFVRLDVASGKIVAVATLI